MIGSTTGLPGNYGAELHLYEIPLKVVPISNDNTSLRSFPLYGGRIGMVEKQEETRNDSLDSPKRCSDFLSILPKTVQKQNHDQFPAAVQTFATVFTDTIADAQSSQVAQDQDCGAQLFAIRS